MSRRGGLQANTLAMFARLDDESWDWVTTGELAWMIAEEFDKSFAYARHVVWQWRDYRGEKIQEARGGRTRFFCSRPNASLNMDVLAAQRWRNLSKRFRMDRPLLWSLPVEEKVYIILLAELWFMTREPAYRRAFNKRVRNLEIAPIE